MRIVKRKNASAIITTDSVQENGASIENKIKKMIDEGEPLETTAPILYTARKEGVKPEYDIRTDRWAIAQEGMQNVSKSIIAKRQERIEAELNKEKEDKKEAV